MIRSRWIYLAVTLAALGLNADPTGAWGLGAARAEEQGKGEALRPEVGKPLQAAQALMKAGKPKEALARIAEAGSVAGRTAFENFIIDRMRGAAAAAAGNTEVAVKSFEAVIASGRLPAAEQLGLVQALAGMHYRARDYSKAASWAARYFKEGGTDAQVRTLLAHAYFQANDFANAAKELQAALQVDEKAGRTPTEDQLKLLANCYLRQNDGAGYVSVLEKLVVHHPKNEYWADLINRLPKRPGFADRLVLDVYRLQLAAASLGSAGEYMEMAQLALQAGFPIEARKIVEQGYAAGALGAGGDAERHKRLRDAVSKQAAEDQKMLAGDEARAGEMKEGTGLVNVGFTHVGNGQFDKGLALMEQGIAKGGLKRPEDARLHLGVAYLLAGQKAKAIQAFKAVQGTDGTAELARLWIIHASRSAK